MWEEDDRAFLERRALEERGRMRETSCIVRSVHEEMAESYDERRRVAEAETDALERLLDRLD